jgi:hypothetical protein
MTPGLLVTVRLETADAADTLGFRLRGTDECVRPYTNKTYFAALATLTVLEAA